MSRVRRFSPWVLGMLAATPLAPAGGQNLDAGKPASQIFSEACASCHRSPRELRRNVGSGFLREHYTTGSEMASIMAAYLSSVGGDPRAAGSPQQKRQPPGTTTREASPADSANRDSRRTQQTGDPKSLPGRPASARADATKPAATAETKPPGAPAPPALEEFEE